VVTFAAVISVERITVEQINCRRRDIRQQRPWQVEHVVHGEDGDIE
jgi:hypothetical protein